MRVIYNDKTIHLVLILKHRVKEYMTDIFTIENFTMVLVELSQKK